MKKLIAFLEELKNAPSITSSANTVLALWLKSLFP